VIIPPVRHRAIHEILQERSEQVRLWGEQNHDPVRWLAILVEEVGEAAKAQDVQGEGAEWHHEMVQVAAVATAIIECYLRRNES
jgi:hypothetical protein